MLSEVNEVEKENEKIDQHLLKVDWFLLIYLILTENLTLFD